MKDANVQWHPGFIGAMNLELKKNRDDLFFEKEYNLNTKPLEIDLLVIKKNTEHVWPGSLSDSLEKQNLVELLEEIERLRGKADKESAQSVLEVGLGANKQIFEELIGDESMSEELLEILKPVLEPKIVLREQQIRKEDIKVTVDVLREFGHQDCEIKTALTKKYGLSEKEAESFLQ